MIAISASLLALVRSYVSLGFRRVVVVQDLTELAQKFWWQYV